MECASSKVFVTLLFALFILERVQPFSYTPKHESSFNGSLRSNPESQIIEDKVILGEHEISPDQDPGPDYRLPGSLIPVNYHLQIRPIIDNDYPGIGAKNTAPGFVRLRVTCVEATQRVVMHQRFLTINESSISVKHVSTGVAVEVTSVEYDEIRNFLSLGLVAELVANDDYEISMEFIANVPPNDGVGGLYSETYYDPLTQQNKVMAVTQLEPLRARQVMPCMDEPTYKATFDLVIGRREKFTSLGNANQLSTEPDLGNPGWFWDTFNTTVKMPTYLLAIAVSEYDYTEAPTTSYRLPVRVHGPNHLVAQGSAELAANVSAEIMQKLEEKYGVPHHGPKVDSISVPYKSGGMENYGLVTYGEKYLMYYNETTTSKELRGIYNIIAHELGHQWFGNLVTSKWWSDIWLTEGFAVYVSCDVMDALWPDFNMKQHLIHAAVNTVLLYDAGPHSHPIHQEAYNAQQIEVVMDAIGFYKGASLVRLMVGFLGEEVFYSGIRRYHTRFYDSVADQNDLFEVLQEAVDEAQLSLPKNVSEIMSTWTLQQGFPLIRASLEASSETVRITQEPWQNADVRNNGTPPPSTVWDVPVEYLVQTGDNAEVASKWLLQEDVDVSLSLPGDASIFLANGAANGYYRTLYDSQLVSRILEQLNSNHEVFEADARVRLLDDQFQLGFQDYQSIGQTLEFTRYLDKERDLAVWSGVLGNLLRLKRLVRPHLAADFLAFKTYMIPLIDRTITDIMTANGNNTASLLSSTAILFSELVDWSCTLGSLWCYVFADDWYWIWDNSDIGVYPIPTDIQQTLYCKIFDSEIVTYIWMYSALFYAVEYENIVQKQRIELAITCHPDDGDEWQHQDLLSHVFGPDNGFLVYKSDSIPFLQRLLVRNHTAVALIEVMKREPQTFLDYYDGNVGSLVEILNAGSIYFGTEADLQMLQDLVDTHRNLFGELLNPLINAVRENIAWMDKYGNAMISWMRQTA